MSPHFIYLFLNVLTAFCEASLPFLISVRLFSFISHKFSIRDVFICWFYFEKILYIHYVKMYKYICNWRLLLSVLKVTWLVLWILINDSDLLPLVYDFIQVVVFWTLRSVVVIFFEGMIWDGRTSIKESAECNSFIHYFDFCRGKPRVCAYIPFIQKLQHTLVGLSGLGVTCSPRDPSFAGSNPSWFRWIFLGRKNHEHKSSRGTLSRGSRVWDFKLVKKPQAWKNRPLSKI